MPDTLSAVGGAAAVGGTRRHPAASHWSETIDRHPHDKSTVGMRTTPHTAAPRLSWADDGPKEDRQPEQPVCSRNDPIRRQIKSTTAIAQKHVVLSGTFNATGQTTGHHDRTHKLGDVYRVGV